MNPLTHQAPGSGIGADHDGGASTRSGTEVLEGLAARVGEAASIANTAKNKHTPFCSSTTDRTTIAGTLLPIVGVSYCGHVHHTRVWRAAGFVLVGGRSSRMGRDKRFSFERLDAG